MGPIIRALCCLLAVSILAGCEPADRKRPIGLMRLGKVDDFLLEPVTHLPKFWLKIFRDQAGLSAMSTLCSKELEPLLFFSDETMKCPRCNSKFSPFGHTTDGPAHSLPYFKLRVGTGDTPQYDTLYVNIGEEVSKDWRLKIIEQDELEIEAEDAHDQSATSN